MDIEAFKRYYIDPISVNPDELPAPFPQIFKSKNILKIAPEESDFATRNIVTFINKNLDIITLPSEGFLYFQVSFASLDNNVAKASLNLATNYQLEARHWYSVGVPSSCGLIQGFDYKINDVSIDQQNNSLSGSLHALNGGLFSPENRTESFIGLSEPKKGAMYDQVEKAVQEWKVPLKYFIPFLRENKILWGVKQTLSITREDLAKAFVLYLGDENSFGVDEGTREDLAQKNANDAITGITFSKMELHIPYVRLENTKQLALWQSMYASKVERYWLSNDQFLSSPIDNTIPHTNEIHRIATKGLNNQPRYLLLHAVSDTCSTYGNQRVNKYEPIGFSVPVGNAPAGANDNTLRVTKLRVKLNGIYVDAGDVLEMTVPSVGTTADPMTVNTGFYRPYEAYCKYFGKFDNKNESSPVSYKEWLKRQIYVFDLTNIDTETIFANSGNSIIVETEFSTVAGTTTAGSTFKWCANLIHDKKIVLNHSDNKVYIEQS